MQGQQIQQRSYWLEPSSSNCWPGDLFFLWPMAFGYNTTLASIINTEVTQVRSYGPSFLKQR